MLGITKVISLGALISVILSLSNVSATPTTEAFSVVVASDSEIGLISGISFPAIKTVVVSGTRGKTLFSISPALPPGLTFNTRDGSIGGTPIGVNQTASYTVTVSNSTNVGSASLLLSVRPPGQGTLDRRFGASGVVKEEFQKVLDSNRKTKKVRQQTQSTLNVPGVEYFTQIVGMAIQPDGKIVVVGHANIPINIEPGLEPLDPNSGDVLLARYNPDGTLDSRFGDKGITVGDYGGLAQEPQNVTLQSDGSILVSGADRIGTFVRPWLARYTSNGSLDNSFGNEGLVILPNSVVGFLTEAYLDSNGDILATGILARDCNSPPIDCVSLGAGLAKFTSSGASIAEFGDSGILILESDFASLTSFYSLVTPESTIQRSDGSIIFAGGRMASGQGGFACVTPEGQLCSDFGVDGVVEVPFGFLNYGLSEDAHGRIVAVARKSESEGFQFYPFRLTPEGIIDADFTIDPTVLGPPTYDRFVFPTVTFDGDVYLGGCARLESGRNDYAVWKFLSDGTFDSTFGDEGLFAFQVGDGESCLYAMDNTPTGQLLLMGAMDTDPRGYGGIFAMVQLG